MSQNSFMKKIKFSYFSPPVKKQGSVNLIFLNNFLFYSHRLEANA